VLQSEAVYVRGVDVRRIDPLAASRGLSLALSGVFRSKLFDDRGNPRVWQVEYVGQETL
jgi:hypothetical protein